jgi:hypothetical protein
MLVNSIPPKKKNEKNNHGKKKKQKTSALLPQASFNDRIDKLPIDAFIDSPS